MNLNSALQTYIVESRELLQEAEHGLLQLENDPGNQEWINAIFRGVHTIKGSAGLFGLDAIVEFTHVAESLLDKVRNGEIAVTPDLVALLLACVDHIAGLVTVVAEQGLAPGPKMQATEAVLLGGLRVSMGETVAGSAPGKLTLTEGKAIPVEASGGGVSGNDNWHISLRFGRDVLRNGMDPLSFVRYLGSLGEIVSMTTLLDALPSVEDMDPEDCYLGFEIDFNSIADKTQIESVFDFVREDSVVHILPSSSMKSKFIDLIRALPEDDARLGEILVASGALTRRELDEGLLIQSCPGQRSPFGEILVEQQAVAPEVVESALNKQKQVKEHKAVESRLVRVHADKLDALINLVGELVIASASANLLAQRAGAGLLQEATSTMSGLVEEIRDGALRLRMVPIGETFNRFQRVVRDVGRELGKEDRKSVV